MEERNTNDAGEGLGPMVPRGWLVGPLILLA